MHTDYMTVHVHIHVHVHVHLHAQYMYILHYNQQSDYGVSCAFSVYEGMTDREPVRPGMYDQLHGTTQSATKPTVTYENDVSNRHEATASTVYEEIKVSGKG